MLFTMLEWYDYAINDLADNRFDHWLIATPVPITTIAFVYLMFVLKWGPKFMENKRPYNLKPIMIVYNMIQMVVCVVGSYSFTPLINFSLWYCNPMLPPEDEHPLVETFAFTYMFLKILDLMDTVFCVLKKNNRQITVLHVSHHTAMLFITWWSMRYAPSGHAEFMPYMNTIVHAVMYTYYLITALDSTHKNNLWIKKQITHLQFLQFFLGLLIYGTPLLIGCDSNPKSLFYIGTSMNGFMVVMFSNFYYQTYIKKKV